MGKRLSQELQAAGLDVTDVWQAVRTPTPYPRAVPVLIRWVRELSHAEPPSAERDRLLEGVVRALSVPEARPAAAETLLDLFPKTTGPLQWIVGNALEITTAPAHADRLLDLIEEAHYGASRQMLVLATRRVAKTSPRTLPILRACVDDDTVAAHAMTALAVVDPHVAVEVTEKKQLHPDPAIGAAALTAHRAASTALFGMPSPFADGPSPWTGPPLTADMVRRAEETLGVRLPPDYLRLLRQRNGGVLRNTCFPTGFQTSWSADHFQVDVILGIGHHEGADARSAALIAEWGYPDVGVVIGVTPAAGPDTLMLDYFGAPDADPVVVYVDEDRVPRKVADSFQSFLSGLVPEAVFEPEGE